VQLSIEFRNPGKEREKAMPTFNKTSTEIKKKRDTIYIGIKSVFRKDLVRLKQKDLPKLQQKDQHLGFVAELVFVGVVG